MLTKMWIKAGYLERIRQSRHHSTRVKLHKTQHTPENAAHWRQTHHLRHTEYPIRTPQPPTQLADFVAAVTAAPMWKHRSVQS